MRTRQVQQFALMGLVAVIATGLLAFLFLGGDSDERQSEGRDPIFDAGGGAGETTETRPTGTGGGSTNPTESDPGPDSTRTSPTDPGGAENRLVGTVVRVDGAPIPGARVQTGGRSARTDDSGRFGIRLGRRKEIHLSVEKTGFKSARLTLDRVEPVQIQLVPKTEIRGRISYDGNGLGAPIRVRLVGGPREEERKLQSPGSYRFGNLAFGVPYTILAETLDASVVTPEPVLLSPESPRVTRDLTLDTKAAGQLEVTVVGPEGRPAEGKFTLELDRGEGPVPITISRNPARVSVLPGAYDITLSAPDYVGPDRPQEAVVPPGGTGQITIPARRAATVRLDCNRPPGMDANGHLHAVSALGVRSLPVHLDGAPVIDEPFAADLEYTIWVTTPGGFASERVRTTLRPGRNQVELAFAAASEASVRGRILDDSGAPVSNCPVAIQDPAGDRLRTRASRDGTFFFTGLPKGRYRVVVQPPEGLFPPSETPKLEVAPEGGPTTVEVKVTRGARVRIQLVSPQGHPVHGGTCRLVPTEDPFLDALFTTPAGDSDTHDSGWIRPGVYEINVVTHRVAPRTITLAPGEERDITLTVSER